MKCRDGCENEKSSAAVVCHACTRRVPLGLLLAASFAVSLDQMRSAENEILTWLAADDKRRG